MSLDANSITAIATSVYGAATLALVIQLWRDRVQREKHFRTENDARKLAELRIAFYDAWGYWAAHVRALAGLPLDPSQVGKQFEALIRLECQLRLNGYKAEAHNLGFATRESASDIEEQLGIVGVALGLLPTEYRRTNAVGFTAVRRP